MNKNNQNLLPVVEDFYSLQGEGYYTGTAAYFIRLAGCDVGCHWCDTKPSWHIFPFQWTNCDNIIQKILTAKAKTVVVTGGEPFTYNLSYLSNELEKYNINKHIETSGTEPISGKWNWISFSPKPWKKALDYFFNIANELKIIIQNEEDFLWAEECKSKVNANCKLFLQPEWSSFNKIIPHIVEYIKKHDYWRISIQTHKFMKIP